MKKVFVDNLKMQNGDLVCKDKSGFYKKVFLKQGSLDGACATYSVIMNLLIIRAISEKDTWINAEHKTRETKKLFKVFCNEANIGTVKNINNAYRKANGEILFHGVYLR